MTELIGEQAADRLDAEDARLIKEVIDHDEAIPTAVAAARQVNSRMTISPARGVEAEIAITRWRRKKLRGGLTSVACISVGGR